MNYNTRALHDFGFHSLENFAGRFANKTDARQQGPDALSFASNVEGWDASASLLNAIRLGNAMEEAQAESSNAVTPYGTPKETDLRR